MMEPELERRSNTGSRIPLDVLVELSHEGFDEPFEADAMNVGMGGLSMRAPYLPDIGSRLVCRFQCPPEGASVEADAEVVWAHDSGTHTGEFGLRFVELGPDAHRAIRRMVHGQEGYVPPPPPTSDAPAASEASPRATMVEIRLDGVASPLIGRVVHSDATGMAIEQELPFLKLRTGVTTGDGRRARIEAVDLAVEGDTPRLVVDLSYDRLGGPPSFVVPEADATIPDFLPTAGPSEPHDTPVDLRVVPAQTQSGGGVITTGRETPILFRVEGRDEPSEQFSEPEREARVPAEPTAPGVVLPGSLSALPAPLQEPILALRVWAVAAWATTRTFARRSWRHIELHGVPWGRALLRASRNALTSAVVTVRSRISHRLPGLLARGKRRRTAPPPADSNVARHRPRPQAKPRPRSRRRTVAISAAVAAAVALTVYALSPSEEPSVPPPVELHRDVVVTTALPADVPSQEQGDVAPVVDVEATLPVPEPRVAAPAPARAQPVMPRALAAPSREAGPMPRPTFPSLREGARPQAPDSMPQTSPYAVDVRGEAPQGVSQADGRSFGAPQVAGGRRFTLRMSRPVRELRGTREADGFTVTIPGTLSLDRAGPIAAAHPLVERSMILNRGDQAVLSIRFVSGRNPDYRVVARGSTVEVSIATR